MDKQTLSQYGWIVVAILVLSVMIALATPFGQFVANGIKSTYTGFGEVNNNALGIFGQTIKGPAEVKYYQPYRAEFEYGTIEFVFHKDGTVDIYQYETGRNAYGEIAPAGTAVYKDGIVEFDGIEFKIGDDGTTLNVEGPDGEKATLTLIPTPIKPLYMNTDYVIEDGIDVRATISFKEDGSGVFSLYYMGEQVQHEDIPAGSFKYFNQYFEEYDGEICLNRYAIYPDGSKIICGNMIYNLSCPHENTEIINKTDDYTGDKACADCGAIIEKGMHLTGNPYALYLASINTLVFTRSETEIKVGDIYDGNTVTAVYTGYEEDMYTVGYQRTRSTAAKESTVPWFEFAYEIQHIQFDCIVKPTYTVGWFYCFELCPNLDLSRLDMSNVVDASYMFACSGITSIPKMNIGNKVKNMEYMFEECENLIDISNFTINNGVTNISAIFHLCTNVSDFSTISIPSSVVDMTMAFSTCESMTKAPNMNNATGVLYMGQAFWRCSSLVVAPNVPSAESMGQAFEGCTSLTTIPLLPSNLIYGYNVFADCYNIVTYVGNTDGNGNFKNYPIPNNVEDLSAMFRDCKLITSVPDLDHCTKLTNLHSAFRGCKSLINAPKLPASIENIALIFYLCENLETAPHLEHCTNLKDMSLAFSVCRKLKEAPIIPYGVEDMKETFSLCNELSTYHGSTDAAGDFSKYIIPETVKTTLNAFSGCSKIIYPPII